jgi:ParB family chromosome partitioning protein
MSQTRRSVLGRGLSALIPDAGLSAGDASLRQIPLIQISAAEHQPRTHFDHARLVELSVSIGENGILQPIIVRQIGHAQYTIIAGERRYRAAKLAGLEVVPVVVRDSTDQEAYDLALVENLQREDLNPLEEAEAFRHLVEERSLTQTDIGKLIGKDRATVSNALRLLKLSPKIQELVQIGSLTAGHGRAVLTAPIGHREPLAHRAAVNGWSVRETERRARQIRETDLDTDVRGGEPSPGHRAVEAQIRSALGAPVRLVNRAGKGRIELRFNTPAELERLIELLSSLEGI